MADWTTIDPNDLLPGEPVTSALVLSLEENPRAIAEGAVDAPRVQPEALDNFFIGQQYGASVTLTFSDIAPLRARFEFRGTSTGGSGASYQFQLSNDDGASWSASQTIASALGGAGEMFSGTLTVDFASGEWNSVWIRSNLGGAPSGTVAGEPFDAIRFFFDAGDKLQAVHAEYTGRG
jgi:hypothetical protein